MEEDYQHKKANLLLRIYDNIKVIRGCRRRLNEYKEKFENLNKEIELETKEKNGERVLSVRKVAYPTWDTFIETVETLRLCSDVDKNLHRECNRLKMDYPYEYSSG